MDTSHVFAALATVALCAFALPPAEAQSNAAVRSVTVPSVDPQAATVLQTGPRAEAIRANLKRLKLPPGFTIELYAVVPGAHHLAVSPADYGVFVGTRKKNVWVVTDPEGEAKPDQVRAFAPSLSFRMPSGVCLTADGFLVVVEQNRVRTFSTIELFDGASKVRVVEVVPEGQLIPTKDESPSGLRACRIGTDKKLYVALGSQVDKAPRAKLDSYDGHGVGAIVRLDPFLATGRDVYADGIANAGGIDFNPKDNTLWFTDDRTEPVTSDNAEGEINRITQAGQFFGYPWLQGKKRITKHELGGAPTPQNAVDPEVYTEPGAGNLGLTFYTGTRFPQKYRGGLFTVQRGSSNGDASVDARVLFTSLRPDGRAAKTEVFAEGWLDKKARRFRGRPVDVAQLFDGSLIVSDEQAGALYRISYDGP